jgi:hypothetical protein
MRSGDWCSQVSLRSVARECYLDTSTVTRAYQLLTSLGCLRRTDGGRDAGNPFQRANAITEIRVPRELTVELGRMPNRARTASPVGTESPAEPAPSSPSTSLSPQIPPVQPRPVESLKVRFQRQRALEERLSPAERSRFNEARRLQATHMTFDADTTLSPEDRGTLLNYLQILAAPRAVASDCGSKALARPQPPGRPVLSFYDSARLQRALRSLAPPAEVPELMRQVAWSLEKGALKGFNPVHAVNIAAKKIREGVWTRPNRMPPHWQPAPPVATNSPMRAPAHTEQGFVPERLFSNTKNTASPVRR